MTGKSNWTKEAIPPSFPVDAYQHPSGEVLVQRSAASAAEAGFHNQ